MHGAFFLQLAAILALTKIAAEFCERVLKQPAVIGELIIGCLIGPSVLRWIAPTDPAIATIAGIGAVLLLFEVGLECDLSDLLKVGWVSALVAVIGMVLPFVGGYFASLALGLKGLPPIFIGAALTATSIGVTARVLKDLNLLQSKEARIILGAAIMDDVLGLIVLAVVTALAESGVISIGAVASITGVALAFLVGAIVVGAWLSPHILRAAHKMHAPATEAAAALVLCFALAGLADIARLAPIIGAFAAGLILARTEQKVHFEEKIKAVSDLFVPFFFVFVGSQLDLALLNPATPDGQQTWKIGLVLAGIAVVGKMLCGFLAPSKGINRFLIGSGMVPRGEVGLVFAAVGLQKGILSAPLFGAILLVVICADVLTPVLLKIASHGHTR